MIIKKIVCVTGTDEAVSKSDIITRSKRYASEVIIYDDGSTNDTYQVAASVGSTVIRNHENKG